MSFQPLESMTLTCGVCVHVCALLVYAQQTVMCITDSCSLPSVFDRDLARAQVCV